MRVRLHQLNPTVGAIDANVAAIRAAYEDASAHNIDLLIVTELATCGYPPMDLLERRSFLDRLLRANDELTSITGRTALAFGTVTEAPVTCSRPIFNSVIVARHGQVLSVVHKTLLPTYDIFDEFRYFEPNTVFAPVVIDGISFGFTICEDIWNSENEIVYHRYLVNPAEEVVRRGANVIVNVSASPFSKRKADIRIGMLRNHVAKLNVPMLYVNQAGANTEVVFDGDSLVLDRDGALVTSAGLFGAAYCDVEVDTQGSVTGLTPVQPRDFVYEERMFMALVLGIRDYVAKSGMPAKALLGLSGGIDSALVAVLAKEALGADAVMGVTMPSEFSSAGSVEDSLILAKNLGIRIETLAISAMYDTALSTLDPLFSGTPFSLAEENLQSRIRGQLLMAISNKFGHIVLNTGNKSEMAVGYCTLYGDMAGGLSVISDVYKSEVYALCRWLNDVHYKREVIPETILSKAPSAELRSDQKDSDSLPEYDVLDPILKAYIEEQRPLPEIAALGFDPAVVDHVVRLVDGAEYKRRQAPPGLRISAKAFGIGRRLPIAQQWREQAAP